MVPRLGKQLIPHPQLPHPMLNRIINTVDLALHVAAVLTALAAPVAIMAAYWILCSTH